MHNKKAWTGQRQKTVKCRPIVRADQAIIHAALSNKMISQCSSYHCKIRMCQQKHRQSYDCRLRHCNEDWSVLVLHEISHDTPHTHQTQDLFSPVYLKIWSTRCNPILLFVMRVSKCINGTSKHLVASYAVLTRRVSQSFFRQWSANRDPMSDAVLFKQWLETCWRS